MAVKASTNMDFSSSSTRPTSKDAPIELLPIEIKAMIIEKLSYADALTLKFCSPTFYYAKVSRTKLLIRPCRLRDIPDLIREPPFDKWIYRPLACATCGRLRSSYKFTDKMKRDDSARFHRANCYRSVRSRTPKALQATSRFCVDCGTTPNTIGHQIYARGTWLRIGGLAHIVCVQCNTVDLSDKRKEKLCRRCWEEKTNNEPLALVIRPHAQSVDDDCRMGGSQTSHGTTSDSAEVTEASLAASDMEQFLVQQADAHVAEMIPAKAAKGTNAIRKIERKKDKPRRGVSRESEVWYSTRIQKTKSKSRSTADTASLRKLKRTKGDWKPELPPWHNTALLPLPITCVDIHSNNAVSSETFIANISSVHIVPTATNAALSDAQLWGKLMLNARLVNQPYLKHEVGWKDGPRDVEMEDEDGEEEVNDENSEQNINDENSDEDVKDEKRIVKIEDETYKADIKNKNSEPQIKVEDPKVEATDMERSLDTAKRQEAKKKLRADQAKRVRQRSLRWLSSAQLSKMSGSEER